MPENDLLKKIEFYVNTLSEVEDNKTTTYVLEYYKDKNIDFIERDISIKVAIAKIYSTITTKHPEFNNQNKLILIR